MGQILLAKRLGKKRIIAETGAGQHGVATATACAMMGLECIVYMGEEDIHRQAPNVYRMKLLGASVETVLSGSRTLKDAINEAIRDWVTNVQTTHYLIGSAVGPHPYPMLVRDFQNVIGTEARAQSLEQIGQLPDYAVACVGGGSNAIGLFSGFVDDESVGLIGVEAGGDGVDTDRHSATITKGRPGVLHGAMSYLLQDEWDRFPKPTPYPPASTTPASDPNTPTSRHRTRKIRRRRRRSGPRRLRPPLPNRRHHPRPEHLTPSLTSKNGHKPSTIHHHPHAPKRSRRQRPRNRSHPPRPRDLTARHIRSDQQLPNPDHLRVRNLVVPAPVLLVEHNPQKSEWHHQR